MASTTQDEDLEGQRFVLPDGRTLAYSIYGSSTPAHHVFYFHSYPGSRLEGATLHDAAASRHLQLIAVDRPGMGSSTLQPERRILDWPSDVLALADHLAISQFACAGTSGGGPYVLACYYAIPRARMPAAAIVAGLWPTSLGTQGMLLESRAMLFLAPWVPGLVAAGLDFGLGRAARDTQNPERFAALVNKTFESRPGVDAEAWRHSGAFQETVVANLREAFKNGAAGSGHEAKLYGSDWGFALDEVSVEQNTLAIWHGGLDQNVPPATADKASKLLAGCDYRFFPDEGHVSIIIKNGSHLLEKLCEMLENGK